MVTSSMRVTGNLTNVLVKSLNSLENKRPSTVSFWECENELVLNWRAMHRSLKNARRRLMLDTSLREAFTALVEYSVIPIY